MWLLLSAHSGWLLLLAQCEQKFQVYRDTVLDALVAGDETDQLVVAYKLLLNNKRYAGASVRERLCLCVVP